VYIIQVLSYMHLLCVIVLGVVRAIAPQSI
jgi:hypothetical protein